MAGARGTYGGEVGLLGYTERHVDLGLAVLLIAALLLVVVQLPPALMDLALVLNFALSLVILLTSIYVPKPLEFSAFPSLLLLTTFYRLALNIATTRLILGATQPGPDALFAAGKVIRAFGLFVAGDNLVVGAAVFAIIVVVQFVVITKGATRISEVGARFTLDAMPGKQLSIDADLNAGLIDEETARRRREEVVREADFYGAMDGASKFIRGDAIAGIIIVLANIIGGLAIGILQRGMTIREATDLFTKLTIGDGLVTQVPALVVSLAAGLIVTRSTARANLGRDLARQLLSSPKSLFITAGFLLVLLPSGLPAPVLLALAAACGGAGWLLARAKREASAPAPAPLDKTREPESVKERALALDQIEIEVGYGLIDLVEGAGKLPGRIGAIREKIAMELGFVAPSVRIRDNMRLEPRQYAVKLRGVPIARGELEPERYLAMAARDDLEPLAGKETTDPAFGLKAVWIARQDVGRAEALGYTVVDATSVMATHLAALLRRHAAELLTREEVAGLIERLRRKSPAVVCEVVPDQLKTGQVQKVLQLLLREGVSIRDLETIFEALADWAPRSKDPEVLSEYARHALGRAICKGLLDAEGRLHAVTLDPNMEEFIDQAIERSERGSSLALSPEVAAAICAEVGDKLMAVVAQGRPPVVLCAPQIRFRLRALLAARIPDVAVLALGEVAPDVEVVVAGNAAVKV
ncbi:MAG TPA: flagellar biosynthesis protein FlhA [Planctomycetota bacterium]|jgi:flagellar biosynthesis protein FlhA|nr:flagellar biosynthesis protein FlhA [Planctomycetota bacterium]OQC21126.1 MAG: Flagellar biosynthesis protein FlhA [Planctomycetes bacterium ADurb.Bin069]HNR99795.1 flagellar biosynthesis protein FlhA [Planctomycetota bacterium]HNU26956.1 flagellar biosynthesis protein FlhA [Planctomycetota bacterium]HOE29854.1 flagellar biosynthesis protein FlhA [Planctomycetota bacterium]